MNSLGTDRLAEAIKDSLIGGREDFGNSRSGTLKISVTTILKPSAEQGSELPPDSLVNIEQDNYPMSDFRVISLGLNLRSADVCGAIKNNHIDIFIGTADTNPFDFIKSVNTGIFEAFIIDTTTIIDRLNGVQIA